MSSALPTLLIIDGSNLLRTIFEAMKAGEDFSPARWNGSCMGSMLRLLRSQPTTHAALVVDVEGETFRHQLYPDYQAHRAPAPEMYAAGLPKLVAMIQETYGIAVVQHAGVDGDDVINTLALRWAASDRGTVTIATSDKDMLVTVGPKVVVYNHFKQEIRDEAYVRRTLGIEPRQVSDYLAMMGDTTDGIPGIPGVGNGNKPPKPPVPPRPKKPGNGSFDL